MLKVYMSNLLIRIFSVKGVVSYCRISQIHVLVFSSSVLLQPLEADLVRTNYNLSEAKLVRYLLHKV